MVKQSGTKKVNPTLIANIQQLDDGAQETAEHLSENGNQVTIEKEGKSTNKANLKLVEASKEQVKEANKAPKTPKTKKLTKKQELEASFHLTNENPKKVSLSSLIALDTTPIKGARRVMRVIDKQHVEHLKISYEKGDVLPPIVIVTSSFGNIVINGYHRWSAREAILTSTVDADKLQTSRESTMIDVETLIGLSEKQIIKAAFEANLTNGLPMSDNSRSRYALWMLEDAKENGTKLSMRQAALEAGVSHAAVSKMKSKEEKKKNKMVDSFLEEAEDIQEASETGEETEDKKDTEKLASATKRLFSAIKTVVACSEDIETLSQYFQKYITQENKDNLSTVASAIQNTINSVK